MKPWQSFSVALVVPALFLTMVGCGGSAGSQPGPINPGNAGNAVVTLGQRRFALGQLAFSTAQLLGQGRAGRQANFDLHGRRWYAVVG